MTSRNASMRGSAHDGIECAAHENGTALSLAHGDRVGGLDGRAPGRADVAPAGGTRVRPALSRPRLCLTDDRVGRRSPVRRVLGSLLVRAARARRVALL